MLQLFFYRFTANLHENGKTYVTRLTFPPRDLIPRAITPTDVPTARVMRSLAEIERGHLRNRETDAGVSQLACKMSPPTSPGQTILPTLSLHAISALSDTWGAYLLWAGTRLNATPPP